MAYTFFFIYGLCLLATFERYQTLMTAKDVFHIFLTIISEMFPCSVYFSGSVNWRQSLKMWLKQKPISLRHWIAFVSVLLGLKCLIQHLNIEQLSQCFSTQTVFSLCLLHNTQTGTWIRDAFVQLESQNRLKLKEHLTLSWIG